MRALVNDPVPMHVHATLTAFSGYFTKVRMHEIGVKMDEGIEEEVEGREWGLYLIKTYNMYT